jgi:hypothetical protein
MERRGNCSVVVVLCVSSEGGRVLSTFFNLSTSESLSQPAVDHSDEDRVDRLPEVSLIVFLHACRREDVSNIVTWEMVEARI